MSAAVKVPHSPRKHHPVCSPASVQTATVSLVVAAIAPLAADPHLLVHTAVGVVVAKPDVEIALVVVVVVDVVEIVKVVVVAAVEAPVVVVVFVVIASVWAAVLLTAVAVFAAEAAALTANAAVPYAAVLVAAASAAHPFLLAHSPQRSQTHRNPQTAAAHNLHQHIDHHTGSLRPYVLFFCNCNKYL